MSDTIINYEEDKEQLKSWGYNEPVIEIHTQYSHTVVATSKICYSELKRVIDDANRRIKKYSK